MNQHFVQRSNKNLPLREQESNCVSIHGKDIAIGFPHFSKKCEGIFRNAIWPLLLVGQAMGVMPVCGISSEHLSTIKFKWKSKRTLNSLLIGFLLSIHMLLLLASILESRDGIYKIGVPISFGFNTITFFCFLVLATKWPNLVRFWTDIEHQLPSFPNAKQKRRFNLKIRLITFSVLFLALFEQAIDIADGMYFYVVCKKESPLKGILGPNRAHTPYLNGNVDVSVFTAIFIRTVCFIANFNYSFRDIFIVNVGMIISTQFKIFNDELKRTQENQESREFWIQRQIQYIKLRNLVKSIDKKITHLIFLSVFSDLLFICRALFLCLNSLPTVFDRIYFWYSLVFIILRTFLIGLSLSAVNDESKEANDIVYELPLNLWSKETKRFSNEVTSNEIAFSGMKFFYITRKMLLSVVGTIVTYELVLYSWNMDNTANGYCGRD